MLNNKRLIDNYLNMVRINSITGNEKNLALHIKDYLIKLGLDPKISYYDSENSPIITCEIKGSKPGPTLLMIGHIDTVDVANGWLSDPFDPKIEGDLCYGLGSMDMKGGLACILECVSSIIEDKQELQGNLLLAFVPDEEYLSRGTYKLIQDGLKADMAIMAECRYDSAAIGFRGRYSINVVVKGITGHASHYPEVGHNAIVDGGRLAGAIETLPTQDDPALGLGTWCIRHIEGGYKKTLNVPDRCELFVDRYVVGTENYDTCKQQILEAAKSIGIKEDMIEISLVDRPLPYMDAFSISKDELIVKTIAKYYQEIEGKELVYSFDKSVCDSNFLVTKAKIPTITFGPSGENMHGANEYGYLSQIDKCSKIYYKTILEILS